MKKTYIAAAIAAAFSFAGVAQAQDYQMEAGLSYLALSPDVGPSDSAIGVDFTYFLETVSTNNRPLSEAYFLGHNSNVSAFFAQLDKADTTTLSLGGEFWLEKVYLSAGLTNADDGIANDDFNDYEARVGFMVQDGLLLNVGFADGDSYADPSILLAAKYVGKLGENFVNLEAELETNDGDSMLSLVGDYFFSNEFSAGLRVTETDVSGVKTQFGVGAKYFFTPVASVEAEYTTQDSDNAIGLRVAMRF